MSGRIDKGVRPLVTQAVAAGCVVQHRPGAAHDMLVAPNGERWVLPSSTSSYAMPGRLRSWLRKQGVNVNL